MIIFIALLCLIVVCVGIARVTRNDFLEFLSSLVGFIAGILLFALLIGIPMTRYEVHAFEQRVEVIRRQPSAGVAGDMGWKVYAAATNAKIAKYQYANDTLFDWWVPDDIDEQEPVL